MSTQCMEIDWDVEPPSCNNTCRKPAVIYIHWQARNQTWAQCESHAGMKMEPPSRQVSEEEFLVLEVMLS